jgi:hypothetical protein
VQFGAVSEADLRRARSEIAQLRASNQRIVEAVSVLLGALEPRPTEEPVATARRRERGVRRARELLYVARLDLAKMPSP